MPIFEELPTSVHKTKTASRQTTTVACSPGFELHCTLQRPKAVQSQSFAKPSPLPALQSVGYWLLCIVCVLALALPTHAQTRLPLLITQTPPANAATLADLTAAGTSPWSVTLQSLDLAEPNLQVALRVRLEGQGLLVATRAPLLAPPITLTAGQPLVLTAAELAAYLAPGNLIVQGTTQQDFFSDGGLLPPGGYTLCVEAVPLGRSTGAAAGEGCVALFAASYAPALLTYPIDGRSELPTGATQLLPFAWQHRGLVPPGASYELEVWDATTAQGQILSIADVLAQRATLQPPVVVRAGLSYNWQAADPQFEFGHEYIARVRTLAGPNVRLSNQGYSVPIRFTYGAVVGGGCAPVSSTTLTHVGQTEAQITWVAPAPADVNPVSYVVKVRPANDPSLTWEFPVAAGLGASVGPLARDTEYEFVVQSVCASGGLGPGKGGRFRTLRSIERNATVLSCGGPGEALELTGVGQELSNGQTFSFGGFEVRAVAVTGNPQTGVSGDGTLVVPWLEQGVVHVKVSGIRLDATGRATAGTVSPVRNAQVQTLAQLAVSAQLGSEDCLTGSEVEQPDGNGFYASSGKHYLTGTPWDPRGFDMAGNQQNGLDRDNRGFDQAGNYVGEGAAVPPARVDTAGCDVYGFTESGLPCGSGSINVAEVQQEYADFYGSGWGDGGFVDAAADAVNEGVVQTSDLPPWAKAMVNQGIAASRDSLFNLRDTVMAQLLQAFGLENDSLAQRLAALSATLGDKAPLRAASTDLNLPRELLFGVGDSLGIEGMSKFFPDGLPTPLPAAGRSPNVLTYEQLMIDRFSADTARLAGAVRAEVFAQLRTFEGEDFLLRLAETVLATYPATELVAILMDPVRARRILRALIRREIIRQARGLSYQLGTNSSKWQLPGVLGLQAPQADAAWAGGAGFAEALSPPPPDWRSLLPPPTVNPLFGYELPIRIQREVAGETYTVVVERLVIDVNGSHTLDAYAILPVPQHPGEAMAFAASGIPVTPGGFGAGGEALLSLRSPVSFGLGAFGTLKLVAAAGNDTSNYVKIDCRGFAGFKVSGEMLLCRNVVEPVDADGVLLTDPSQRVVATVEARGDRWPQFTLIGSITGGFRSPKLASVVWTATDVVVDYSQTSTPTAVAFPSGYAQQGPAWRGLYIGALGAQLVSTFESSGQAKPSFSVANLLADGTGVSATATVGGVLPRTAGSVGDWPIGIDTVRFSLRQNALSEFYLSGDLELPTDGDNVVRYSGQWTTNPAGAAGFVFSVASPTNNLNFDMWRANLKLDAARLTLSKIAGNWQAEASLDGTIKLELPGEFGFEGLRFDKMELSTEAPYFGFDRSGGGGISALTSFDGSLGAFNVSLQKIGYTTALGKAGEALHGISLKGGIGLMGGEGGFGVGGEIAVFGTRQSGRWRYHTYDLKESQIKVKVPGVYIDGGLAWVKDDPVYGRGFTGSLTAMFDGIGMGVTASGTFGNVNDMAYWTVDAAALFPEPSPVILVPPALVMSAIGGGASWNMEADRSPESPRDINLREKPVASDFAFGKSLTGITYIPKAGNVQLRLMAGVATNPKRDIMAADFVFTADFSRSQGLNYLVINGSAAFLTMPDPTKGGMGAGTPAMKANVAAVFAPRAGAGGSPKLTANLEAFLNYPSYQPTIVGRGTGGRMGQMALHMERGKWFLWFGTPKNPLGVKLTQFGLGVDTYLDVGSELPRYPGLPKRFDDLGLRTEVRNARNGFMHGTEISVYKEISPWRFEAKIDAVLGYNVLLTNGQTCPGKAGGFGLDGWRMAGSAYAGFYASLGVRAPGWVCVSCPKTVNLASVDATAAAYMEGPNDYYATGGVRFEASLFGGIWEPTWSGKVTFGKRCENVQGALAEEWEGSFPKELIADVAPRAGDKNVALSKLPELSTTLSQQPFYESLPDPNDPGKLSRTRDRFKVTVSFQVEQWNPRLNVYQFLGTSMQQRRAATVGTDGYTAYYDYSNIAPNTSCSGINEIQHLEPNRKYRVQATASLRRLRNNQWEAFAEKGHTYSQTRTWEFETGVGEVPASLVEDSSPAIAIAGTNSSMIGPEVLAQAELNKSTTGVDAWSTAAGDVGLFDGFELWYDATTEFELGSFGKVKRYTASLDAKAVMMRYWEPNQDRWVNHYATSREPESGHLTIRPGNMLQPERLYQISISIELRDEQGQILLVPSPHVCDQTVPYTQQGIYYFKTREAPTQLVAGNVRRSYPYPDQYNVYLDEPGTETWFIDVSRNQHALYTGTRQSPYGVENPTSSLVVRYIDTYTGQSAGEAEVEDYRSIPTSDSGPTFKWSRPSGLLPGGVYTLQLAVREEGSSDLGSGVHNRDAEPSDISSTGFAAKVAAVVSDANGSMLRSELPNNSALQVVSTASTTVYVYRSIYESTFRVSHYPTIASKLAAYGEAPLVEYPLVGTVSPDFDSRLPRRPQQPYLLKADKPDQAAPAEFLGVGFDVSGSPNNVVQDLMIELAPEVRTPLERIIQDDSTWVYPVKSLLGTATCAPQGVCEAHVLRGDTRDIGILQARVPDVGIEPFDQYELAGDRLEVLTKTSAMIPHEDWQIGPLITSSFGGGSLGALSSQSIVALSGPFGLPSTGELPYVPLGIYQPNGGARLLSGQASDADVGIWYAERGAEAGAGATIVAGLGAQWGKDVQLASESINYIAAAADGFAGTSSTTVQTANVVTDGGKNMLSTTSSSTSTYLAQSSGITGGVSVAGSSANYAQWIGVRESSSACFADRRRKYTLQEPLVDPPVVAFMSGGLANAQTNYLYVTYDLENRLFDPALALDFVDNAQQVAGTPMPTSDEAYLALKDIVAERAASVNPSFNATGAGTNSGSAVDNSVRNDYATVQQQDARRARAGNPNDYNSTIGATSGDVGTNSIGTHGDYGRAQGNDHLMAQRLGALTANVCLRNYAPRRLPDMALAFTGSYVPLVRASRRPSTRAIAYRILQPLSSTTSVPVKISIK